MRAGVGQLETAIAVAKFAAPAISTALGVASFFGGGKKKKHQITAAENQHLYERSATNTVNGTLPGIHQRIAAATTPEACYAERKTLPAIFENAMAKALTNYAMFGAAAAEKAVANIRSWQQPIYAQGGAMVEEMIKERIGQLEAPARAIEAAHLQQESETRFAQKIAYAIGPQEPTSMSATSLLLIAGGLGAAWWILKGKKR